MRFHTLPLGFLAALSLAACADVRPQTGGAISGTSAGTAAPPLSAQSREMGGGSPNASGGTATITGARGGGDSGGRPAIERSGATGPGAGANPYGSTSEPLRVPGLGQRGGGGG